MKKFAIGIMVTGLLFAGPALAKTVSGKFGKPANLRVGDVVRYSDGLNVELDSICVASPAVTCANGDSISARLIYGQGGPVSFIDIGLEHPRVATSNHVYQLQSISERSVSLVVTQ